MWFAASGAAVSGAAFAEPEVRMNATLTIDENVPALEQLWTRLVSFVAAPGDDDEALRKQRLLLVVVLAKAPVCPSWRRVLQPRGAARRAGAGVIRC